MTWPISYFQSNVTTQDEQEPLVQLRYSHGPARGQGNTDETSMAQAAADSDIQGTIKAGENNLGSINIVNKLES